MPIEVISGRAGFDTRGLPYGFDPHKFYEYRYETLVKEASGIESFAYKFIPFSLLKSFAFAIDPLAKFKVSPHAITPANRDKYRTTASVLQKRTARRWRDSQTWTKTPNYGNVQFCMSPYYVYLTQPRDETLVNLTVQEVLSDYLNDTTGRTRLVGSLQGELQLFKSTMNSPPRVVHQGSRIIATYNPGPINSTCQAVGGSALTADGGYDLKYEEQRPTGATLPRSTHTNLRNSEIAFAQQLCTKHAPSLLAKWSPASRNYTLFRNVVELKDLPRTIRQTADTLKSLRDLYTSLHTSPSLRRVIFDTKKTAANIPKEYLAYHFGWKLMYKDLVELLDLPEKMTKKYNLLIKRSGKPTTFRTGTKVVTGQSGVSGFSYDVNGLEHTVSSSSRIDRVSEVRLVINATFDFPPINNITFSSRAFYERIGAVPRPTDLYNLIPWTWLVDWFTGLGNYVELIDETNRDESLINWGMITCKTVGKLTTDYTSKSSITDYIYTNPGSSVVTNLVTNNHTSVLNFECQTRSDVAAILGVKKTSVPSTLTTYQKSILGALLAQRTEHIRKLARS